jgi:NADPH:quinone reductase
MSEDVLQKRFVLDAYPTGDPEPKHFRLESGAIPVAGDGQFVVRASYFLVEPRLRLMMNPHYEGLGKVMPGTMIGEVIDSRHPSFKAGDIVHGLLGWQTYALSDGSGHKRNNPGGIVKVDLNLGPVEATASVLGLSGLTSYFAFIEEGKPRPGDTLVVTTAAGAVGSIVGQLGKLTGCRVVGVTGSEEKVKFITEELGFDVGINYRKESDLGEAIRRACPNGVDIYVDIVGGKIADEILKSLKPDGRHVLVGLTSFYNSQHEGENWRWPDDGSAFVIHRYHQRYDEALPILAGWLREGKLRYKHDVFDGFESLPSAFAGLFAGDNIGKRIVRVTSA